METEPKTLLKDHIDQPMLKSTVGLNLLGIETRFSCCGFTYKNESVPKNHLLDKPYFYINARDMAHADKSLWLEISMRAGWVISPLSDNIFDFHAKGWASNHDWAKENSVHRYEISVLAINKLEGAINQFTTYFLPNTKIVDGNKVYIEQKKVRYWQYDPCEDWIVTPETYKNL